MSTITMTRPTDVTAEHNHSCIAGQCSVPCTVNAVARPETDVVASPELTAGAL